MSLCVGAIPLLFVHPVLLHTLAESQTAAAWSLWGAVALIPLISGMILWAKWETRMKPFWAAYKKFANGAVNEARLSQVVASAPTPPRELHWQRVRDLVGVALAVGLLAIAGFTALAEAIGTKVQTGLSQDALQMLVSIPMALIAMGLVIKVGWRKCWRVART